MIGALLARFRALPRPGRWLVAFGVALAAYFVVVEPIVDLTLRLGVEAGQARARLEAYDDALEDARLEVADVALGLRRFGEVRMPGPPERRPGEFNRRVGEILRAHDIEGYTTRSSAGTLRSGPLSEAYESSRPVGTRVREIQFVGAPETVSRVLADLERSPEVAAVTGVTIAPADDRRTRTVEATITAEAWIEPEKERSP